MKLRKKDWIMITVIVVAVAFVAYAIMTQRENLENPTGATMTGEWITNKGQPVQKEISLPDGTKVYAVQEGEYTKMGTADGKSRNYVGPISDLSPAKWNSGNVAPDGVYKVVLPAPAAPAPPPAPTGPSPVSAPGPAMSAGNYSASCSKCAVVDNQISCACDVIPVAK